MAPRSNQAILAAAAVALSLALSPSSALARDAISCEAEIGAASADRLKAACRNVSPATHPPCGTSNSCALIKDEIVRGCAFLGDVEATKIGACGAAPTSAAAAIDTLRRYYEAIDERDYDTAFALLKPDAVKKQSLADFRSGFAKTRSTRIEPGPPGAIEGAAGSAFVTIPVNVEATLEDGTQQKFAGTYVLRRVNPQGLDTPIDTRWFIFSADLRAMK